MLDHYAVMGNPIQHSLSPQIHELFAKQTGLRFVYEKILIDEDQFEQQVIAFFQKGGKGLNITLPCKERAFHMSQKPSSRSLLAKAANTLWQKEGQLYADNTDGIGLIRDLKRFIEIKDKKILLLGAGGAARGILSFLLEEQPNTLTITNRTLQKAQVLQDENKESIQICSLENINETYDVIINATSTSLSGFNSPLPEFLMKSRPFCYDLAYQLHNDTAFVQWAKRHEAQAVDGLGMLVHQAAEAFFIWHGIKPDPAAVLSYFASLK